MTKGVKMKKLKAKDVTETMPVIFRILDNEVIAFFPTETGTYDINTCSSYMRVGQHGSACTSLITDLKKATVEEYTPLYKELLSIYTHPINLVLRERNHSSYFEKRRQKLIK